MCDLIRPPFNHANQHIRIHPYFMENTNVPYIDNSCKKVSGFISTKKNRLQKFRPGNPKIDTQIFEFIMNFPVQSE